MRSVQHNIVPSIHLLPVLKFLIQTLSPSLNCLVTLGKNTFFFNSTPGFIMLSFEFNFQFIKSSVNKIPVVLCSVILYINKHLNPR